MKTTLLSGALLAVALPFALAGTADASALPHATVLNLTVVTPDGPAQTVALTCEPSGGTHPSATGACRELRAVNGDFDSLSAHQQALTCTMEYRPVIAVAGGTWRGRPVTWWHEYSNPCTLRTATGRVFRF